MTSPVAGLADAGPQAPARPDLRLAGVAAGVWAISWCCLTRSAGVAALIAVIGGVGLAAVLTIIRRPVAAGTALVLLGIAAGATSTGLRVWARDGSPMSALAGERAAVTVWLVVTDDPRAVSRQSSYGRRTVILTGRVTRLAARGQSYVLGGRIVVLATDSRWSTLLPSQRLRASGRLASPRAGDLTVAVLSARGPPADVSPPSAIQRAAGTLRAGLRQACQGLPAPERGLLPGLVIGDTSGLDPALAEDFRTTGMTHLLAVSGTNCAIVCGAVLLLVRRMRAGPRTAALLAGLALLGFVVLVRPSPSVLRAAVMGGLALLALAVGRSRAALPGLCTAVLVLVLVDPALARSAGFALSVVATAGLLLLAPPWRDALRRRRLPRGVAEAIAVPAAAQVACAPVIVAISAQIGLVAVPANLLAVPAVAPATVLGVVAAVVSPVWPAGAEFIARLAGVPTSWLVTVAEHGARIPGATVTWPGGASGGLFLAAALAMAVLMARLRLLRRMAVCSACVAAVVALPVRAVVPGWPPQGWVMVVCDVGQGDALVLNAGLHAAVVVDAGPEPSAVDSCLRRLKVVRVPLLVITHLHIDHIGGLAGVLRGRAVAAIAVGPLHEPATAWDVVRQRADTVGIPVVTTVAGETHSVAGLRLHVLGPAVAFNGTRSDANNSSVMLRVEVAGRTILLSGDAEVAGQQALLAAGTDLRADVLKIAHHGSHYQDPRFLAAAHPAVAVVSVGVDNTYGHPSQSVLARLRLLGARVQRTDRNGDIAVVIARSRLMVVVRGPARRPPSRSAGQYGARAPPRRRMANRSGQLIAHTGDRPPWHHGRRADRPAGSTSPGPGRRGIPRRAGRGRCHRRCAGGRRRGRDSRRGCRRPGAWRIGRAGQPFVVRRLAGCRCAWRARSR